MAVNLVLRRGELFGIVVANSSEKSILLRAVPGFLLYVFVPCKAAGALLPPETSRLSQGPPVKILAIRPEGFLGVRVLGALPSPSLTRAPEKPMKPESKYVLKLVTAGAVVVACLFHPNGLRAEDANGADRRPNVIIILLDDLGYTDIGVYGAPKIRTPYADRMAAEGVKLTDFYAESLCSPTRAALLTGSYAERVGMDRVCWPDSEIGLHPDEITIADLLREQGYATACIGKWHLGHHPEFLPTNHGFDYYFGLPFSNDMGPDSRREAFPPLPLMRNEEIIEEGPDQRYLTRRYTAEAIGFMEENRDRPFFLYLAHTFPHVPLYVSEEFEGVSEFGLYGDVVEELDWSTGRILEAVEDLGLDEDTLVVFASDNGPWLQKGAGGGLATPLRDGKGTAWEGGHRVPAIMRWPGRIPAGKVVNEITTVMDLYPTLAELAGAELPGDRVIDGRTLLPLLTGEGEFEPYEAYFYYRLRGLRAVRAGEWKFHREGTYRDYNNIYYDYTPDYRIHVYESLFNLDEDPAEQRNLALDHPELVEKLKAVLEEHEEEMSRNSRPLGDINDLRE